MKLAIIIAAIIIAVAIFLSNGVYVPMAPSHYLNKFTGECFNMYGEKFTKPEREKRSAKEFLRKKADDDPLDLFKEK
jgi:hypothetical protein